MRADGEAGGAERLDEVLKLVRTKVASAQRATVEDFAVRYFQDVDAEDLAERQPADLYGAMLSHWNFARKRDPGRVRVRVLNPTLEEHGWQSTHTVVEIVNDDMPFLVDSVTMEVNRHGLTLHLIMHPIVAVERGPDGTLTGLARTEARDGHRESFIHVEVDRMVDPAGLEALAADIVRVLDDVRSAAGAARRDQGHLALDGASARLPRLHRGEAFQRQRRSHRGRSFSRALHLDRLQRQSRRDPAASPQDRQRREAREPAARRPRQQGAGEYPGDVSEGRAVPDQRRESPAYVEGDPSP